MKAKDFIHEVQSNRKQPREPAAQQIEYEVVARQFMHRPWRSLVAVYESLNHSEVEKSCGVGLGFVPSLAVMMEAKHADREKGERDDKPSAVHANPIGPDFAPRRQRLSGLIKALAPLFFMNNFYILSIYTYRQNIGV